MGKEEPEAENRLGENIENSIGNDLGVNAGNSRSIGDTPDANRSLAFIIVVLSTTTYTG